MQLTRWLWERVWCLHVQWRGLKMSAALQEDVEYERAIMALNGLQTNAAVLEHVRKARREAKAAGTYERSNEISKMYHYLQRTGLKVEDLDGLNAIHITGTKGKGSVSAMCECILRSHGFKTGFYNSPHLLEVRERIRINGKPLTKTEFVSYFWDCYNQLASTKDQYEGKMPAYFRFLTVLAFNVFLKEKVDVAVVEVGVGGKYDSTNILPNPVVCAITSLGYDHVDVLGDTLEQIAWHKGGICKPDRPVFTLPQPEEPLRALAERAKELKARSFQVAPDLAVYPGVKPELALLGRHQEFNASLAIQTCRTWLQEMGHWSKGNGTANDDPPKLLHGVPIAKPFLLPSEFYEGLKSVHWAGRNQIIKQSRMTYYLDGAHTPLSVKASAEWFSEVADQEAKTIEGTVVRVMLFNTTGRRKSKDFLQHLVDCGFDYAIFCPNIVHVEKSNSADLTNLTVTRDSQYARSHENKQAWIELCSEAGSEQLPKRARLTTDSVPHMTGAGSGPALQNTQVFDCIDHVLQWTGSERNSSRSPNETPSPHPPPQDITTATHIQFLVTGSLHLVGAFMRALGCTIEDV